MTSFLEQLWLLLTQVSPYLLLGFFFAGLLHLFFPVTWVARHLGGHNFFSVLKAVLLGIPLPLCSCGVVPAAATLRKQGASYGAVVSFLIATPITGLDSILVTYSLLGLPFTLVRLLAASCTALLAGLITNWVSEPPAKADVTDETAPNQAKGNRFRELFRYAFVVLMRDTWRPLSLGLLVGALITTLLPQDWLHQNLGSGFFSLLVMMLIGIPMYVCATGSIPIAAALVLKGLSPGAALVFLLTGPATNSITIVTVHGLLGKRAAAVYLATIMGCSLLSGWLLDLSLNRGFWLTQPLSTPHQHPTPDSNLLGALAAVFLLVLMALAAWRQWRKTSS